MGDNQDPFSSFIQGNCYCGGIQYRVRVIPEPKTLAVYCHCDSCRRAHAAPCYQVVYIPQENFTMTAGQHLLQPCQRPGQHIIRSFCRNCGSRVTNTFDPPRADLGVGFFPALLSDEVQHNLPACLRPRYHHLAEDAVFDLSCFHDDLPRGKPALADSADSDGDRETVTARDIEAAARVVSESAHVRRTPLLTGVPVRSGVDVCLKLENCQVTGSFKIRGMVNAFHHALRRHNGDVGGSPSGHQDSGGEHTGDSGTDNPTRRASPKVVTMSAGNAGKSFAYLAGHLGLDATVVMPDSVPNTRQDALRALGATVETRPLSGLQSRVDALVAQEGRVFVHPFDDSALIAGHASVGLEILEDCRDVDVVVVCCGGGGLVAGIAAAVKQLAHTYQQGHQREILVFAVEPAAAPTMTMSVAAGTPQTMEDFARTNTSGEHGHTCAHGLAAPYAGKICFEHVKKFVDGCVLVTDEELAAATKLMFQHGVVAETSGCAAVAAVMFDRLPIDLRGKKVACVVSGSNIQPHELADVISGVKHLSTE
eukprot:m.286891 g.286891  ORF g.286891 m.286891 type:complete len:537 (+) comp19939_c0_seq2:1601-3211(+)